MAEKEAAKPITNWLSGWSEGEAAVTSSNKTLAELFGIDPKVLRDKFDLEPGWQYDPTQNENLVFLSPTVLLDDRKIRDGGPKDRGPKEILSRVVRDMLDPKQTKHYEKPYFFQVPEIPNMRMGYGLTSVNKKNKMAITKEEAKLWIRFLDLAKRKKPGEVLNESGGTSEEPMEVVTYPTPEDTQAFEFEKGDAEELINPENSGLKRPVKGSFLLFFSILLIFYQKKLQAKEYSRDKGTQIGPNKISDFHIFWVLPYLLNFNQRKVNDIINHHKRISEEKGEPMFKCQIIQKSAKDILESAFNFSNTPPPISGFLMRKFEKYYGEACAIKYNLPQSTPASSRSRCNEQVFMHYWRAALGCCRCCQRRAASALDPLASTEPEPDGSEGAGPFVSHTWSGDSEVSSGDSHSKQASFGSVSLYGSSVVTNRSVQSNESVSDAQSSSKSSKGALIDDDVCGFWKPQWYHGKSTSSSGSSSVRLPSELTREEGPVRSWIEAHANAFPPSAAQEAPAGSFGHPNQCSPCVFFATRAKCNAGQRCAFCHFPHSMTQVRRRLKAVDAPEDSGDETK